MGPGKGRGGGIKKVPNTRGQVTMPGKTPIKKKRPFRKGKPDLPTRASTKPQALAIATRETQRGGSFGKSMLRKKWSKSKAELEEVRLELKRVEEARSKDNLKGGADRKEKRLRSAYTKENIALGKTRQQLRALEEDHGQSQKELMALRENNERLNKDIGDLRFEQEKTEAFKKFKAQRDAKHQQEIEEHQKTSKGLVKMLEDAEQELGQSNKELSSTQKELAKSQKKLKEALANGNTSTKEIRKLREKVKSNNAKFTEKYTKLHTQAKTIIRTKETRIHELEQRRERVRDPSSRRDIEDELGSLRRDLRNLNVNLNMLGGGQGGGGYGPTQQVAYGPYGPGGVHDPEGGGAGGAGRGRAEEIEAMTRAGMTSRQIQEVLMGEREKKNSGKAEKEEKNKYKAFGENTGYAMGGMINIFNPAMFGNILMIIVIVLMMWIVIQFFGMV